MLHRAVSFRQHGFLVKDHGQTANMEWKIIDEERCTKVGGSSNPRGVQTPLEPLPNLPS